MNILFYLCDECKEINFVLPEVEDSLKYVEALICRCCEHEHEDLKDLTNYAKATRGYL